jgi:hypothetical protein
VVHSIRKEHWGRRWGGLAGSAESSERGLRVGGGSGRVARSTRTKCKAGSAAMDAVPNIRSNANADMYIILSANRPPRNKEQREMKIKSRGTDTRGHKSGGEMLFAGGFIIGHLSIRYSMPFPAPHLILNNC